MPKFRACLDLTLAMAIVGSSVAAGAHVVAHLPVHFALFVRFVVACAWLVPWCILRDGGLPRLNRRQWLLILVQSFCGVLLFNVLLLEGLRHADPGAAGIVTSTTPACMALFAWLLFGERPGLRSVAGIALCVAGLAVLQGGAALGVSGGNSLLGLLLVLGAVVSESLFLLLRKALPRELSALGAATAVSLAGLLLFAPLGLWQARDVDLAAISPQSWLVLLYYGLGISAAAYLFWFRGVQQVSGSVAGVFTAVLPLSALGISALVLGTPVTGAHLLGCALVLGAIVLLSGIRLGRAPGATAGTAVDPAAVVRAPESGR